MAPDGVPCEFRGFLRKLAKPSNHDETAKQRITSSNHAIWRLSHGDSRPSMKNGESPGHMQSRRRAVEDDHREIKSPLRGFKWLSRRYAPLNVGARRFSRSPARDERPPPRDRISPTGGTRSVASVRRNPNGTSHPPTRRPRRLPPCNLAKTDCGVARYSGRRSHIGLCQIRVCAASAFPRRTRRSAPLTFPSADATSASLPYPHEPHPARSTI